MAWNDAFKNAVLDSGAPTTYLSLHDNDPSTSGANEISGGSPAYARKAVAWASAASGAKAANAAIAFDVPPAKTVKYVGRFSALTGGTFYGAEAVTNEVFAGQGTYTLSAYSISET